MRALTAMLAALLLCMPCLAQPAWSPLIPLTGAPGYGTMSTPVFDAAGNAWVSFLQSGSAQILQSSGTSGAWQTVYSTPGPSQLTTTMTGAVHAVYTEWLAGQLALRWQVNLPGLGWQPPVTLFSTSETLGGDPQITADSNGNVVVVFPIILPQGNSVWTIVYSAASSSWGTAHAFSPAGVPAYLPTLARSPDHSHVMAVYYLKGSGAQNGIYSTEFSATTLDFVAAQKVPRSSTAGFFTTGTTAVYPLAVDNSGNAALVSPESNRSGTNSRGLTGFRYESGRWTPGVQLLDGIRVVECTLTCGSASVDAAGNFLIATAYMPILPNGQPSGPSVVVAFRFSAGLGWRTETAAQLGATGNLTFLTASLFGSKGDAVIAYSDIAAGRLMSVISIPGGAWSALPVPGDNLGQYNVGAMAPTGEVLLIFPLDDTGTAVSTWLRP